MPKSPVWRIVPAGVRSATAEQSGMEWVMGMNSAWKGPTGTSRPYGTSISSAESARPCSPSLGRSRARVKRRP